MYSTPFQICLIPPIPIYLHSTAFAPIRSMAKTIPKTAIKTRLKF